MIRPRPFGLSIVVLVGCAASADLGGGVGVDAGQGAAASADGGADTAAAGDVGTGVLASMDGASDAAQTTEAGPGVVGQLEGGVATKLPTLPQLTNVTATLREDSVGIDFDPLDGAIDYRVYPLPSDGDITVNANGSVTVHNAIYRCAGLRQTFDLSNNLNGGDPGLTPLQYWSSQVTANPTLGYVYVTAAAGRAPVYALAGKPTYGEAWRESRFRIYTTDANQRQMLLGQNWRDDGIVFYAPSAASAQTHTIYSSQAWDGTPGGHYQQYYFGDSDLGTHAKDATPPAPAFQVLTASAADTEPLMAVFYNEPWNGHTELAAGKERFNRAANQGNTPLWHVEWAGITGPTTLVVEALASGCPFQGFLSPQHLAATTSPPHQALFTLDELKTASTTGEVFINGEYDTTAFPKAIARSFVEVTPQPHNANDWDWYQGFNVGTSFGTATTSTDPKFSNDQASAHWTSPLFDFGAYSVDNPGGVLEFTYGQFLGQFWTVFDDWKSDVTGRVRFTALQKANVDSDTSKFLHVTMSVDIVGTDRRYPQLIVSDQPAPVEDGFANASGNTLLVQTIQGPTMRLEAQAFHGLINGSPWAVNNQAQEHRFIDTVAYPADSPTAVAWQDHEAIFEHAGMDRMTKFDVFVSSRRLYVFFDGIPAGCTQYPSGFALQGPVTVTFGDVLYHEGAADELVCGQARPYSFLHRHQCTETKRHFDDLGFKSGVSAPAWDETKLPCGAY
jgi:hypothetical protein